MVVAKSKYIIAVRSNANPNSYTQDLIDAMDLLAPVVAASLDLSSTASSTDEEASTDEGTRRRRRLAVSVELPTTLDGTIISSK
jgi:hypothetical protein